MKTTNFSLGKSLSAAALILAPLAASAQQVYHVATAQALQNALTMAATNGLDNTILITNGYYTGNFNYNSATSNSLTLQGEPGVTNTQITFDGGGLGADMNLANSSIGNITVNGVTFLRNCGNFMVGALSIAGGNGSSILVQNCQFLSPPNDVGIGLAISSGLDAVIANCVVAGPWNSYDTNNPYMPQAYGGIGIVVDGVSDAVTVQSSTIVSNIDDYGSVSGLPGGILPYGAGGIAVFSGTVVNLTKDVMVANGGNYGGAVFLDSGPVTVAGNLFANNSASQGGAIFCLNGLILSNNTITDNSASDAGGGLACWGQCSCIGNIFSGNSAHASFNGAMGAGGAALFGEFSAYDSPFNPGYATAPTVTLVGNSFITNEADFAGGGVYSDPNAATLESNTFTGNIGNIGGGAYCVNPVALVGNTFTGNSCVYVPHWSMPQGSGGGAYLAFNGYTGNPNINVAVCSNTFQNNTAAGGGGLYVSLPVITLEDNLIVKNLQTSASSQGGGVWVDASSSLFMVNNTIFGNAAAGSGGGAAFEVTGTVELLNVYNNIIWGNSASGNGGDVWLAGIGQKKVFEYNDASSMYGVWDIAQDNIDLSPNFFNPVAGDFHIQSTSPCAAAGDTNAPALPGTDLDGNPFVVNGSVAMGCYEFTTNVFHPADLAQAWTITPSEFSAYAAAWKSGQSWPDSPNPIPANYLTRAGYLMTNGAAYYNDGSARPLNWKLAP